MARGYLGKISAVISANTGDYVRKLNESAKETAAFARTVQQTLGRASSEASKSLEGIYTPLQKVERALRAAASQKLAFRGFDGAIRDVQSLQSAIAKLTDKKTIDLVVKTSGVGSLDELKRTIGVLRNQDVTIGVEGLRQQRAALGNTKNFVVKTEVREEGKRLDDVIEALERIDAESLKKISLQVEAQQLDAAALKLRQLVSAGKLIGEPLAAAAKQYDALSLSVQAAFGPSLKRAQQSAESLGAAIDSNVTISQKKFAALRRDVELTAAAIGRLSEAEAIIGRLGNGTSLRDVAPRQFDALNEAARIQQRSSALSGEQASGFGVGRQEAAVRRQAEILNQMRAEQERLRQRGGDTTSIDAAIERQTGRLEKQVAVWARLVGAAEKYKAAAAAAQDAAQGIGQRTFIGNMGRRTDISQMGRSSPFFPGNGRGNPTGPFGPSLPEGFGGSSDAGLGRSIDDPQRRLEGLRGSIVAVKSQVEQLPQAIQGRFIPAIQAAEVEFRRLAASPSATAEEIERAATNVRAFTREAGLAANAARQFGGTFAQFRDSIDARSAAAGLEFLRAALSRATGDATRAAGAVDRLAEAYQQAASTPGGFRQNAADLQRLANEAIEATAATNGVGQSANRLARGFARAGDVARGAFGNAGLAIQQAAFAIEDFFSVTGGLDQRVRAAGNNISQLGFILGGTTGLIVGISAAIGAQLVAALIRWYNEGRTAEDQTKALNDALARQKSLVEDLAQAFESLGDSISRRAFSAPAQQARQFSRELEDIAKKQKELRESRVADLDEGVQRERANQNRIERELQTETGAGRRVVLQRELAESRRREREAASRAAGRRFAPGDVQAEVREAVFRGLTGGMPDVQDRSNQRREADEVARSIPRGTRPDDILAQRRVIEGQIESFRGRLAAGNIDPAGANAAIAQLERLLKSLELPLQKALDELTISILRASQAASLEIESAQADVADAVRRGVPGAALLQQNLDAIADEMDAAQTRLRDAQKIEDPNEREQQIRLAQRDIDGIRAREDAIAEASRDIRLTSGRGGERTTAALSALQGNERFANEYGGLIARLRAAVDAEMVARLANEKAMKGGTDAEKEAARAAYESAAAVSDMAAAAAEAALAMEQAVGRIRKIGADALSQSERMADEAQQRLNERPTDENRRRRDEAERQLIDDRERVGQANRNLDRRRTELQTSDPLLVRINSELKSIEDERKRLSDEAAKNNTTVDPAEAQRLNDREAKLLADRERRLFDLTEAERRQQDAINQEIAARRRLVDYMEEVERRQNPQGDPVRGLDLLERPGERAARELRQSVADIRAATRQNVGRAIREGRPQDVAGEQQRGREAERRALFEQLRNSAPTIFGLSDSVANAVLQGPSRAALTATDVSTVEGSRELTRLLRGDDAARDQANLVELQREANRLLDIIANAPAPVAN